MKRLKYIFASFVLGLGLFLSLFTIGVRVAGAESTYLNNGTFEASPAHTSWGGSTGYQSWFSNWGNCYVGTCVQMNQGIKNINQSLTSPIPSTKIVIGMYLELSPGVTHGEFCPQIKKGFTYYGNECVNYSEHSSPGWWAFCYSTFNYSGLTDLKLIIQTNLDAGEYAYFDNVFVDYVNVCPDPITPPAETPPFQIPLTTTCIITVGISISSSVVTDELGITSTITTTTDITAVVPANLVNNASFEDPSSSPQFPSFWDFSNPLDAFGVYQQAQPSQAKNGDDSLKFSGRGPINLTQILTVPVTAGGWQLGMHIKTIDMDSLMGNTYVTFQGAYAYSSLDECSYSTTIDGIDLVSCPNYIDTRTGISNTTPTTATDTLLLSLPDMRLKNGTYWIDDVYLIPTDENGLGVSCPAVQEFYNGGNPLPVGIPPSAGYPNEVVGGIPIPIFGAGSVCYECRYPGQDSTVQMHIVWQTCILRNMFSCDLPVYLWAIENGARAAGVGILNLGSWLANNAQLAVTGLWGFFNAVITGYNNFAYYLSNTPQQIYILIYTAESTAGSGIDWFNLLWELITGLFWLIATLLGYLFDALAGLLSLVWYVISGLFGAISAPALTLDEFTGGSTPTGTGLGTPGYSESKMFVLFLWTLAIFDEQLPNNDLMPLLSFAVGVAGAGLLLWIVKEWRNLIPTI